MRCPWKITVKIGYFEVGNVNRKIITLTLILACICSSNAQAVRESTLKITLIELAKKKNLDFLFEASLIPQKKVQEPNFELSTDEILRDLLKDTKLKYRIEGKQLFLYQVRQIFGYLEDGTTGERLVAAVVKSIDNENYQITNGQGFFSISTTESTCRLELSYLGFADTVVYIDSDQMGSALTLNLFPDNSIENIIITDNLLNDQERKYIELDKGSDILLFQNQASSAIGGEPDVFQAMMRQTGVSTGADGIGGLHVRGGKNDQNMILYDGVRIYNPNHAFGLYSVVNNSIVDQARLYKSGSSGSLSGSLSSIMDIKLREPDMNKFGGQVQVTTVASQASLNLPIIPSKLAISITGRRTHLDPIIRSLSSQNKSSKGDNGFQDFFFSDLNAKLKAIISERQRLFITGFRSSNKYFNQIDEDADFEDENGNLLEGKYFEENAHTWINEVLAVRYNLLLGNKTILNARASAYRYTYLSDGSIDIDAEEGGNQTPFFDAYLSEFTAGITDFNGSLEFETIYEHHDLSYGIQLSQKKYDLGSFVESDDEKIDHSRPIENLDLLEYFIGLKSARMATIYLTNKIKLSSKTIIDGGLYFKSFQSRNLGNESFQAEEEEPFLFNGLQGYFKALHRIRPNFHLGFSVTSSLQMEHLLSPADNGYPNDIWIPSTSEVSPQRGFQTEVFAEFTRGESALKIGVFYRKQKNQTLVNFLPPILSLNDFLTDEWEEDILLGSILSSGLEIDFKRKLGDKGDLHIAYTLMQADYQNDEINDGFAFPYEYSIPHTLSIGANYNLGKSWVLNLDWYFASGKTHTLYDAYIDFDPLSRDVQNNVEPLSGYNDFRLPAQHKLSLGLARGWKGKFWENSVSFGVQNLYNRRNAIYQYENGEGLQTFAGFPILPMLRWQTRW